MRLLATTIFALTLCFLSPLQAAVDSLVMGPQYANQVWYQFGVGTTATSPQSNWDLGFETSGVSGAIIANGGKGVNVYVVEGKTPADWETIDTTGMGEWTALHNSPESWTIGALNQPADTSNDLDLGWGSYNLTTHQVVGNRVFVVTTPTATKKLRIDALVGGEYRFTYANIDGTEEFSGVIAKSAFAGKKFGYWSFEGNQSVDREPAKESWHITMLKYVDMIPAGPGVTMAYPVTGILANASVSVARIVAEDPSTAPAPAEEAFETRANVIGWDWKAFANMAYTVSDSTAYFVKTASGDVYRLTFSSFAGSSTGTTVFESTSVVTSVSETDPSLRLSVYPSVVERCNHLELAVDASQHTTVNVYDVTGTLVWTTSVTDGFNAVALNTCSLASGKYFVTAQTNNGVISSTFIVQ
ncbi:MAG: T9SS type A sorting domain-containing protein [Bradyrhizobiaceae bacterium]|nr:T9SS type A sorting domain-containing protein [Bradyrhizobiaceae bacterium]